MLMEANNQFALDRRQVIRRKVLAIGRMSRAYQVLKTNPDLVDQLKSVSINGKLPSGILSGGEQAMKEAILTSSATNPKKEKEQKDHPITFYNCPTPNYKITSSNRQGHV
ncbi:hypothetical protein RMATCC62417_12487 [Rhizopus microsporus]|nr:hypothetical protein RMATCC62417_12487 [Rhizopus microsporus]